MGGGGRELHDVDPNVLRYRLVVLPRWKYSPRAETFLGPPVPGETEKGAISYSNCLRFLGVRGLSYSQTWLSATLFPSPSSTAPQGIQAFQGISGTSHARETSFKCGRSATASVPRECVRSWHNCLCMDPHLMREYGAPRGHGFSASLGHHVRMRKALQTFCQKRRSTVSLESGFAAVIEKSLFPSYLHVGRYSRQFHETRPSLLQQFPTSPLVLAAAAAVALLSLSLSLSLSLALLFQLVCFVSSARLCKRNGLEGLKRELCARKLARQGPRSEHPLLQLESGSTLFSEHTQLLL